MSHPIPLITLLFTLLGAPMFSAAANGDAEAPTASGAGTDMEALYKIDRSEAGNLSSDALLGQQLPADTVVLTMETGDQRFHALRQEADQAKPLGWILLLPDPGVGPAWPEQTEALRFDLAQNGWVTMVLEPPEPSTPTLPERTLPVMKNVGSEAAVDESVAPSIPAPDTDSDEPPQETAVSTSPPFSERFNERMAMALEQLPLEENQIRIVLAIGRAAPWSAAYVASNPELDARLILLDPLPDSDPDAPVLPDLWEALASVPVLDLYHVPLPGYPQAAPDARIRKAHAIRAGMEQYHQARIAPPFTGWQREMPWLTRTIRGIIKKQIVEREEKAREMAKYAAPEPQQAPPGSTGR